MGAEAKRYLQKHSIPQLFEVIVLDAYFLSFLLDAFFFSERISRNFSIN